MEQQKTNPSWQKWLIWILFVAVVVLIYLNYKNNTNVKLDKDNIEKKKITREIDSIKAKTDDVIKTGKENSQSAAENANQTIKTIENEKLYFVGDTTYNAICEFLTEYKPTVTN